MVTLVTGPMFSGKTTEMLRRLERARIAGKKVCLVRPERDTRDFLSHGGKDFDGEILWLKNLDVRTLENYDVVGVDEGQFFDDLLSEVLSLSECGVHVIVAALNLTSECKSFAQVHSLMNHCEELIKVSAVCKRCGSDYQIAP